mgnify:CR=1 FL=1
MTPSPEPAAPAAESQTPQPGMEAGPKKKLRVAAVGDLHVGETSHRAYRDLFDRVHEDADVLCLCGDLVNFGKTVEVENLLEDLRGLGRFDVIFCRNVLIYFDDMARRTAASNLYDSLAPGGYICLGHTESMSRISPLFHVCRFPEAIVYQKPGEGGHD